MYLHYVLDLWVQQWRKRHARGAVMVVRYADDFVTGFEFQDDADRFLAALKERLTKFALELHGDKTRLIEFGRYAAERREKRGEGKPETFNFLGFVHICGMTKQGWFHVLRRTIAKRQIAKLKELGEEMKIRRHESIKEQGAWLGAVLRGCYGYYAVPGNSKALCNFRWEVTQRWYRSLCRRSHKKRLNWSKMVSVLNSSPRRWRVGGTFFRRLPGPPHGGQPRSGPGSTRRLGRRSHCAAGA